MGAFLVQQEGMLSTNDFIRQISQLKLPTVTKREGAVYYNVPAAFDIETTSFYENGEKRAILYHWQFGIGGYVTHGRTWLEYVVFIAVLRVTLGLSDDKILPVYIHNMPYEFQFMRKWFNWQKVFILDERKPVYGISDGVEYRDMLKLAGGKSLAAVTDDIKKYKVMKMVGDLDYSKVRTPLTPLTSVELKYCENDVRVCMSYIAEKIEQDGDITKIPNTNTGYVRRLCRKTCRKRWKKYRNLMSILTLDPAEYGQLKKAFQGGFTHANAHYVGKILSGVGSFDLTSAYPSVMLLEKFPMSKGIRIERNFISTESTIPEDAKKYLSEYCCMFNVMFFGLLPKLKQDHPISESKCECAGAVLDNGRIVTADWVKTTITEQDLLTISEFYEWQSIVISDMIVYEKDYLPKVLAEAILDLYTKKTTLKGIPEGALNYMISKNMLNAAYGMMVTDIVRDIFEYDDDWIPKQHPEVGDAIKTYNEDIKRFLFYPWGVWVTAYCRRNLFSAIKECGDDYVYADTDSVKILHPETHQEYFKQFNLRIDQKIKDAAWFRFQETEIYSPKNKKGKVCTIGYWDFEGVYSQFKTLGAKRYLVSEGKIQLTEKQEADCEKNGYVALDDGWVANSEGVMYRLTVAGTNKQKSCGYMVSQGNPFSIFNDGLSIPPDKTGKLVLSYIDFETTGILVDYLGVPYEYHERTSIHMENSPYHLSLGKQFLEYLGGIRIEED